MTRTGPRSLTARRRAQSVGATCSRPTRNVTSSNSSSSFNKLHCSRLLTPVPITRSPRRRRLNRHLSWTCSYQRTSARICSMLSVISSRLVLRLTPSTRSLRPSNHLSNQTRCRHRSKRRDRAVLHRSARRRRRLALHYILAPRRKARMEHRGSSHWTRHLQLLPRVCRRLDASPCEHVCTRF